MDDREPGRALLGLEGAEPAVAPEVRRQVEQILRRDRRRVRLLAALAVSLWAAASAGVFLISYVFFTALLPKLQAYYRRPEEHAGRWAEQGDIWAVIGQGIAWVVTASFAALLAAAVSTVALVLTSRRATLRQINASLAGISEQLRQLRQALGK
jgi:hypothetical protein